MTFVTVANNLYTRSMAAFEKRRKGSDNKSMFRSLRLTKEADGSFLYSHFHKYAEPPYSVPFVKVYPNGHAAVLHEKFDTRSIWDRNLLEKVIGGGAFSDTTKGHVHPVRWRASYKGTTVPLTKGLVVDTNYKTYGVVRSAEDLVRTTDRKASQSVYSYATEVGQIMDLLFRLGSLEARKYNNKLAVPFHEQYVGPYALNDPKLDFSMNQEALVSVAEAAYTVGRARSKGVDHGYYEKGQYVKLQPETIRGKQYIRDRDLGLKHLREKLKALHGGFEFTAVTHNHDTFAKEQLKAA